MPYGLSQKKWDSMSKAQQAMFADGYEQQQAAKAKKDERSLKDIAPEVKKKKIAKKKKKKALKSAEEMVNELKKKKYNK